MAACPNCQSYILDGQLFCRACGYCLETNFQISTRSLGLPSSGSESVSAHPNPRPRAAQNARHRFAFPLAGFMLALLVGGLSAAPFMNSVPSHHSCASVRQSILSERSYMGVYLMESNDGLPGAYIDAILEESPAEQAGLLSGDRIIAVNDNEINSIQGLVSTLKRIAPGTTLNLKVQRENETFYTTITTARRTELNFQAKKRQGFLGVGDLQSISVNIMAETQEGVFVGKVIENSAAEGAGLQDGDIILSVDGHSIKTPQELARRIRAITPHQIVPIEVVRESQTLYLTASMGER
jgi:C-terminal processing protease CtpA/Prc